MTKQEATGSFTGPLLGTVLELATVWVQRRDLVTFHDPLDAPEFSNLIFGNTNKVL